MCMDCKSAPIRHDVSLQAADCGDVGNLLLAQHVPWEYDYRGAFVRYSDDELAAWQHPLRLRAATAMYESLGGIFGPYSWAYPSGE